MYNLIHYTSLSVVIAIVIVVAAGCAIRMITDICNAAEISGE